MTTITVAAWLPVEPEPQVQPTASATLHDLRAAATAISDVASWARAEGQPPGWFGRSAESANQAVARFTHDVEAVDVALQKATLAVDRFLSAMADLRTSYAELMRRRIVLNAERQILLDLIGVATGAQSAHLVKLAADLTRQMARYDADLCAWRDQIANAEDMCIQALASVDTVAEGSCATRGTRIDTATLAAELGALADDSDAVLAWWSQLSEIERNAIMISDPDLIGNTDGIPVVDRDEANRASLGRDLEYLLGRQACGESLDASELRWLDNARSLNSTIASAGELDLLTIAYQPSAYGGDGIAVVSYGNPDSAEHTSILVPGIMQSGQTISHNSGMSRTLHMSAIANESSVATITWIGYDSPNWNPSGELLDYPGSLLDAAHTLSEVNAEQAGRLLARFVDGLNTTHQAGMSSSHLTVIGHSYGSTTSAHAAVDGMAADALVLLGSPGAGSGVHHASDLRMPPGEVYVGSAERDAVTWLGGIWKGWPGLGLGEDPAQESFGARILQVSPGHAVNGLAGLREYGFNANHTNYLNENNLLADRVAAIVTGRGHELGDLPGRDQDAQDFLRDWAQDAALRKGRQLGDDAVEFVVGRLTDAWPRWWR